MDNKDFVITISQMNECIFDVLESYMEFCEIVKMLSGEESVLGQIAKGRIEAWKPNLDMSKEKLERDKKMLKEMEYD